MNCNSLHITTNCNIEQNGMYVNTIRIHRSYSNMTFINAYLQVVYFKRPLNYNIFRCVENKISAQIMDNSFEFQHI